MSIKNGNIGKIFTALIALSIILSLLPLSRIHAVAEDLYVKDFSYTIIKDEGDPSVGDFHLDKSDTHNPHWIGDSGFTNDDAANLEKLKALDGVVLFSDTARR